MLPWTYDDITSCDLFPLSYLRPVISVSYDDYRPIIKCYYTSCKNPFISLTERQLIYCNSFAVSQFSCSLAIKPLSNITLWIISLSEWYHPLKPNIAEIGKYHPLRPNFADCSEIVIFVSIADLVQLVKNLKKWTLKNKSMNICFNKLPLKCHSV